MDQLRDLSDERLLAGCTYCGGFDGSRDHVPSRVFLDAPLPDHLPVVGACRACNQSFSLDEEYLACLVEAAAVGSADPDRIRRASIAETLRRRPKLRALIDGALRAASHDSTGIAADHARVRNVLLKLARGHAAFELSMAARREPSSAWWSPLCSMSPDALEAFEAPHVVELFGEVGSRSLQRLQVVQLRLQSAAGEEVLVDLLMNDWVEVQAGRYRYLAAQDPEETVIRMVIGEYLACSVSWAH